MIHEDHRIPVLDEIPHDTRQPFDIIGMQAYGRLVKHVQNAGGAVAHGSRQLHALPFYARAGFVPAGPVFEEAGIGHRLMRRRLPGASPVEDADAAAAVLIALATHARRELALYSRAMDPGLLDRKDVRDKLRAATDSQSLYQVVLDVQNGH